MAGLRLLVSLVLNAGGKTGTRVLSLCGNKSKAEPVADDNALMLSPQVRLDVAVEYDSVPVEGVDH